MPCALTGGEDRAGRTRARRIRARRPSVPDRAAIERIAARTSSCRRRRARRRGRRARDDSRDSALEVALRTRRTGDVEAAARSRRARGCERAQRLQRALENPIGASVPSRTRGPDASPGPDSRDARVRETRRPRFRSDRLRARGASVRSRDTSTGTSTTSVTSGYEAAGGDAQRSRRNGHAQPRARSPDTPASSRRTDRTTPDSPRFERGTNRLGDVLRPRGVDQQRFGQRRDRNRTSRETGPRTASPIGVPPGSRVTTDVAPAFGTQPAGERREQRALTAALDAFD